MNHKVPKRIFIDLDDTLNSFTMPVLRFFGCPVGVYDYHRFPVEVGYDMLAAYEKLKPEGLPTYDVPTFWDRVGRQVWASVPMSREFDVILDLATQHVDQDRIGILTSPTKDPNCLAGKLDWIHMYLPSWLWRQYSIGPRKHFCARADSLLIDDSDEQVNMFRKEGGQAILVPRPWNSLHGVNTAKHISAEFNRLFGKGSE